MKQLLTPFVDMWRLLYPRACLSCVERLAIEHAPFCINCLSEFPYTDHFNIADNELHQKFTARLDFINASALLYFSKEGLVQNIIHELKYQGARTVGSYMGVLFGNKILQHWKEIPDYIIPIPTHSKRKKIRGYNQAEVFAQGVSQQTKIPIISDALIKHSNISSQTGKGRLHRFENVLDSMSFEDKGILKDKHILFLDDVCTTGATFEAAAKKIQEKINIKISIGIIAMAQS